MAGVGTKKSPISLLAGEALAKHRLVRLHATTEGTVVYADAGERAIGVTLAAGAVGDKVAIEMLHGGSSLKVIAAGTISANASVYSANDGKVSDSVSGRSLGVLLHAGTADDPTLLLPYAQQDGDTDRSWYVKTDDFDEYVAADFWTLDANNGGVAVVQDAHAGVISLTASDTSDGDNDESYLVSTNEVYKPAIGTSNGEVLGIFKGLVKLTEANTDDANILFGLKGGDTADVANAIVDGGATLEDAGTWIAMHKADGGTVYQGTVRDTALDTDTNVGEFRDGVQQELKMVISDADITDGDVEVEFFVDGVSGGSKSFTITSASEMRLILGVKNGGASVQAGGENLLVDKVRAEFKR